MGQFCKFCLYQQLFAIKRFFMETWLNNILKTTNSTKFIKTILESTYKVVSVTSNLAGSNAARLFVKGCWILSNFWHVDCYNFCYILKKTVKLYFLASFISKIKTANISNFLWVKYFGKGLLFLKISFLSLSLKPS